MRFGVWSVIILVKAVGAARSTLLEGVIHIEATIGRKVGVMGLLPSDLFSVVSTSTTLDIDLSSLSTGTATASPSLATIGSTRQANSLTSPKDSKLSATLYDLAATSATAAPTSFIVIHAFPENGDA